MDEKVLVLRDGGGALGDDLRFLAIEGQDKELLRRLKGVANTASADDLGLTPLMYAVWNGHVECVKLLVANHHGVDKNGERCSALDLQSNLGYTALHLAALDCPAWAAKEIAFLLLQAYTDYSAACLDGRTAIDIARDVQNQHFIEQYEKFMNLESDEVLREKISHTRHSLASKYTFRMPEIPKRVKTKFALPATTVHSAQSESVNGLSDETEASKRGRHSKRMPPATLIPEHELLPLVRHGDQDMRGASSLRCMKFAIAQAEKNAERRIGLLQNFDASCEALQVDRYVT